MAVSKRTHRGQTRYRVRWTTLNPTGKRVSHDKWFRTRAEAVAFEAIVNESPTEAANRITMPELAAAWIADHHPHLAARSASFYTTHLELRVLPYFAATPVAMITPRDVNEWIGWMQAKGRVKTDEKTGKVKRLPSSATVVNGAIRTVKAMMRWSRRSGLTTSRVFDDAVQLPTPNAHAPTAYPPSVVQRIADACIDAQDRALILTAAYTGLRWSELRALCWERVDLQQRTVRVVGAVDADGVTIRQPKTRQGLRLVPILEPGVEALRAWQAECGRRHGLVFTSGAGTPLRENWYRDRMPGIRERAKLPDLTLHQLRDTYGSILIAAGIGETELTMWLGHRSVETTRRHYADLFAARRVSVAAEADRILSSLG